MNKLIFTFTCAALFAFASSSIAASNAKLVMPDFTKGDSIPANAKKDWNLGPTGVRLDVWQQDGDERSAAGRHHQS